MALVRTELRFGAWFDEDLEFLGGGDADTTYATLRDEIAWEERSVVIAGREIPQPRLVAWSGDLPYRYTGQTLPPRGDHPVVRALRERCASLCGVPFNHAVLNLYRDGNDHVAAHADAEPELGRDPVVASLSLGARRRFVISSKGRKPWYHRLWLEPGSLLVMGGTFQHRYRHEVPRQGVVTGPRVNVTFRWLRGPPGWRPEGPAPEASP